VPLELPDAVVIVQLPPPVTALDVPPLPEGSTKVPGQDNVIVSPMLFIADA